jgi:hypothetical protein
MGSTQSLADSLLRLTTTLYLRQLQQSVVGSNECGQARDRPSQWSDAGKMARYRSHSGGGDDDDDNDDDEAGLTRTTSDIMMIR